MLSSLIARDLGVEETFVARCAREAHHLYKRYTVPKKAGGRRTVFQPAKPLKALQRWLLDRIIARLPVSEFATAYRPRIGPLATLGPHLHNPFHLRLDLRGFFPSLSREAVIALLKTHLKLLEDTVGPRWSDEDYELFASLACFGDGLTIGAVTSPALSNALMYDVDRELSAFAFESGCSYTRYADDLFFSCKTPCVLQGFEGEVQRILDGVRNPPNLKLNRKKTYHSSRATRRKLLGLIITPEGGVSLGRERKRRIRAALHQFENLDEEQKASLAGWLAYAKDVDKEFMNSVW